MIELLFSRVAAVPRSSAEIITIKNCCSEAIKGSITLKILKIIKVVGYGLLAAGAGGDN